MIRIGLTGGIAAGKTLVANALAGMGAYVIDADKLAREVVEPETEGLDAVLRRFGRAILRPDGSLDRSRLGDIVFNDEDARADLNAIIHPLVRSRAAELEARAPSDAVVVHVIPLLVETGQQDSFDAVLVVDAPEAIQVERLQRRNNLTEEQANARVGAQASRSERLAAADWVIENTDDKAAAIRRVRELWEGPIVQLLKAAAE